MGPGGGYRDAGQRPAPAACYGCSRAAGESESEAVKLLLLT